MKTYKDTNNLWISDYLKSTLVVLIVLGAMIYCDTDEFAQRCKVDKEYCLK